ncbi:hypothetical protein ACFYNO_23985 [Kitasatospora sp. NPDC006697]|uniref:hypothetical protein n=1 Tax=Kitasatospora sp. NPDC006697 TaxID=3364020 RepID=UPI0036C7147E
MGEEKQGTGQGYRLPEVAWSFDTEEPETVPAQEPAKTSQEPAAAPVAGAVPRVAEVAAPGEPLRPGTPQSEAPGAVAPHAPGASSGAGTETDEASEAEELAEVSSATPEAEPEGRTSRISRPMIAAAVTAGLVLVGLPLAITQLGGSGPHHGPSQGSGPVGFSQQGGSSGGNGYVPGFDSHGDTGGPAAGGGAPAGADSGSPSPSSSTPDSPSPSQGPSAPSAPPTGKPTGSAGSGSSGGSKGTGGSTGGGSSSTGGSTGSGSTGGGSSNTGGSTGSGSTGSGAGSVPGAGNGGAVIGTGGGTGSAGGSQPQPAPSSAAPAPAQPTPAAPPQPTTRTVVAGPYCSGAGTAFHQNGWFSDGNSGWRSNSGGWSSDQCNGTYSSVPMSGDASKDDGNSVIWTFTGLRAGSGSCALAVYIPAGSNVMQVGGNPTYYTVQTGSSPGSGTIGSFTVNQVANQGSWVSVGSYPLSGGGFSVMLHTRGLDWSGSTRTYAHHAADAVRVSCVS